MTVADGVVEYLNENMIKVGLAVGIIHFHALVQKSSAYCIRVKLAGWVQYKILKSILVIALLLENFLKR